MTGRKKFADVAKEWGEYGIMGYGLDQGQTMPETYQQLIDFMVDKLDIVSDDPSFGILEGWLMRDGVDHRSSNPAQDTAFVEAVVLIGYLKDPDRFVAELPICPMGMLPIPPTKFVRKLIAEQSA